MELGEEREAGTPSPVDTALHTLADSLDTLIEVVSAGGLDHHDLTGLMPVLQRFERVRNRMALVDHQLVADGDARGLPDALAQGSMARALVAGLRLSPGEAARRVRAARAVGPRSGMTGESLGPYWPHLAAAQATGEVSPEQVGIVERALARVDRRGFDPATSRRGSTGG